MWRDTPFEWDEDLQKAFDNIKEYLSKPPAKANPVKGKFQLYYITMLKHFLDAQRAQKNAEREKPYITSVVY